MPLHRSLAPDGDRAVKDELAPNARFDNDDADTDIIVSYQLSYVLAMSISMFPETPPGWHETCATVCEEGKAG